MPQFDGTPTARFSLSVVTVLTLFTYIYCTVVFVVVLPWLEHSVPGVMHLSTFTVITILALSSYLSAVFRDPGSVPTAWSPDAEKPSTVMEVKRKDGGAPRFCNKCHRNKPPRTHHCRICNRCVLRMDHHCVWINNCVGHRNYKSFYLFLLYATAACVHALTLVVMQFSAEVADHRYEHVLEKPQKLVPLLLRGNIRRASAAAVTAAGPVSPLMTSLFLVLVKLVCGMLCMLLTIGIGLLLAWHTYLVFSNKTTIEYHEGVRARGQMQSWRHPYDLGVCGNLHAVLGPHATTWMSPTECSVSGDGLEYDISEDPAPPLL